MAYLRRERLFHFISAEGMGGGGGARIQALPPNNI